VNIHPASLFNPSCLKPLRRRFQTLGLNRRHAARLSHFICVQYREQGEGVIQFLKNVSDCLLGFLIGRRNRTPWVKTVHRFPSCLYFLKDYPRKVLFRLTKLHTIITLKEVTKKQAAKFMDAVRSLPPSEDVLRPAHALIGHGIGALPMPYEIKDRKMLSFPLALVPLQNAAKVRALHKLSVKAKKSASIEKSAELILRSLDYLHSPVWRDLLLLEPITQSFYPLDQSYFGRFDVMSCHAGNPNPDATKLVIRKKMNRLEPRFVGNLGFSQEPGGKLRVFASPHLVWQSVLEPLKLFLNDILRSIPQDCTHNQEKGADWCMERLASGETLHSLDLSNATDLFPLSLQLPILSDLGVSASLTRIFERVAKGTWKVPLAIQKHGYPEEVKWLRGQPLGLGPSFALFALSHHCFIQGICLELAKTSDCYRILGDDVVISDPDVARVYVTTMESIGCKIAHEKSISSNSAAEFAGYRITPQERVRTGKFRRINRSNFLELARTYESTLEHEVNSEMSSVLGKYLSLPPQYGGLGMNIDDPSTLMSTIDEQRSEELKLASGDLLEHRCSRVILASGLVTRPIVTPCYKSRFRAYTEILDYGLERGHVTSTLIKAHGVSWAVSTIEACVKAQLCDPARELCLDGEIRRRFNVPLGADLATAKRKVNLFFQRYYQSLSNLNNHNVLMKWLEKGWLSNQDKTRDFLKN